MDFPFCLRQLEENAKAVQALVGGISTEQARWKPNAEAWSILEVINHLSDEEREDFRARVKVVLNGSVEPFALINPPQAVIDRRYNERDLTASVNDFLSERQASLDWLRKLDVPQWETKCLHPPLDDLSAGDFFVSWVAHDMLHLRQLVELKWAYGLTKFGDYSPEYAGRW